MNPMDIYKKLPRKNCGECSAKTCLAFAFALHGGKASVSECSLLSPQERGELESSVTATDWREDLIAKLKEEIKGIRFADRAADLGAGLEEGSLRFRCFGRNVVVGPGGEITSDKPLTPWMRMLVLFYIKNGGATAFTGRWVLHGELPGGLMKSKAFKRECEEPLRELMDKEPERVGKALDSYGAVHPDEFSAPGRWLAHVFPKLPVVLLYWPPEEEFDSKVTIRFDSSAASCFDVEQLIFLVEELLHDIEAS